jgi:hypothetical protein
MSSIIRTYESGNISLVDSALAMNFQSVDKIINMNRNKLVQVNALDKLWLESIGTIKEPITQWDLNFKPHLNFETNSPVPNWENTIKQAIQFAVMRFSYLRAKMIT